ncbi:uncharacterized protein LDX57_007795 [Aspergillus melleus]|uniref:uncharacterized protein n=1 Tax=Aspergillus melleus TaxID=138277 RepID=UPI001E8D376C|nr:uncharacterized protein LDX57_007787 [Aspergillus melleus]XP_045945483.1 uncharacterized protein LDX57_007795 [Aspergillus melleus]KAH8430117.1 hypothetical protein LDX57_007787 [Aspergillus melleus]KAH8430125.1 hypothetical protein LDX57_007795 [Aspergillus melleus]
MAQSSNKKRALRRQWCREALSRHIHNRLGLRIDPNEVRLQPAPQDGYVWSVTDSKAHLLETPLSNGTVGLYEEICRALGHSLEAVRPAVLQADHDDLELNENTENEPTPTPEDDSFTATIQRLEQENQHFDDENERLRDRMQACLHRLRAFGIKTRHLQREIKHQKEYIGELEEEIASTRDSIREAAKVLERGAKGREPGAYAV